MKIYPEPKTKKQKFAGTCFSLLARHCESCESDYYDSNDDIGEYFFMYQGEEYFVHVCCQCILDENVQNVAEHLIARGERK